MKVNRNHLCRHIKLNRKTAFFILLLGFLTANMVSAYSQQEYYADNQIPGRVFSEFYSDYMHDTPVVLQIEAGKFTPPLNALFMQKLHDEGYLLYDRLKDDSQVIKLSYYNEQTVNREKRLFSELIIRQTLHHFTYQVTTHPQGEIIAFDKMTLESEPVRQRTGMSWYDPMLITAILGGLVYLIYFGG